MSFVICKRCGKIQSDTWVRVGLPFRCVYCTTEVASQTGRVGEQHNDDRVDAKINDSLETELRL